MEVFAVLFGLVTAALAGATVARRSDRAAWEGLRGRDVIVYLALAGVAAAVSLFHFEAIQNHAWSAHEESLWFAMKGEAPPDGFHPLEVQVLIRLIYQAVGRVFGATIPGFVVVALFLGVWGGALAGAATQLLTGRAWLGYGVALLLALHPTAAYWRICGFHVASVHVVFAATLLAGVLVARRPSRVTYGAWLMLGSLCLFLRLEQAGAVVATAAIPLLCGARGGWKKWKDWAPGLVAAGGFLAVPTIVNMNLASDREDYVVGLRFARLHLGVPEAWIPIALPATLVGLGLALWVALGRSGSIPRAWVNAARALFVVLVLGPLPSLVFMSFGQRHLLPSSTAAAALTMLGLAGLVVEAQARSELAGRLTAALAVPAVLIGVAVPCWQILDDWGSRYYAAEPRVPEIPGVERPSGPLDVDPDRCASYANISFVCEQWWGCHPVKDLRDPVRVRARWDEYGGCVLWALHEADWQVAGVNHEFWTIAQGMYDWAPAGTLTHQPVGGRADEIHVYKMVKRP